MRESLTEVPGGLACDPVEVAGIDHHWSLGAPVVSARDIPNVHPQSDVAGEIAGRRYFQVMRQRFLFLGALPTAPVNGEILKEMGTSAAAEPPQRALTHEGTG